jgi:membrane protease YdiL (CAAX protease family)
MIRSQIEFKDLFAILIFNILIGLFSIYAIIYGVVNFMPADAITGLSKANGLTGQTTFLCIILAAIGAILIALFAEEFIFRGVLLLQLSYLQ